MQYDRESGQTFADFFEDVEAQLRFLAGFEFVSAVAGADRDGEGVAARLFGEFANLVGVGEAGVFRFHVDRVFDARELAELGLDDDAPVVRVSDDFFRDLDVFGERVVRRVDHDGSKAVVDGGLARFEVGAVVKVHDDGDVRRFHRGLDEVFEVDGVRIFARTCGNLQDQGGLAFLARFNDSLNGLHVVDVERADSIAAFIGFFEHFGRCNQRHDMIPPIKFFIFSYCTPNGNKNQFNLRKYR